MTLTPENLTVAELENMMAGSRQARMQIAAAWKEERLVMDEFRQERDSARAALRLCVEALKKNAQHDMFCDAYPRTVTLPFTGPTVCNCGLSVALAAAERCLSLTAAETPPPPPRR